MTAQRPFSAMAALISIATMVSTTYGGNHTWRFTEFFSNADGSIQFIELQESMGSDSEVFMNGQFVQSTGSLYNFTEDLTEPTGNKFLLLATAGFAALPGAPTPDYIIADNFLASGGDTVAYSTWDNLTYGSGDLPLDGVMSMAANLTHTVNTPTNFAGITGSVVAPSIPAASTWGLVTIALLLLIAGSVAIARRSSRYGKPTSATG